MKRKTNKTTWPFQVYVPCEFSDDILSNVDEEKAKDIEKWIFSNMQEDIRNRVFIIGNFRGVTYYFKNEKDYNWFLWRWI